VVTENTAQILAVGADIIQISGKGFGSKATVAFEYDMDDSSDDTVTLNQGSLQILDPEPT
jgi:hypothetical protein